MTFGEKLRETRIEHNLSQSELAEMTGLSERSLYTYEQLDVIPRKNNIRKLAEALSVSPEYLRAGQPDASGRKFDDEAMIEQAREEFGAKGAREAQEILEKASALFAGGDLDEDAKDVFFQSLMEVYLDSKKNAQEKYTPKRYRVSRKGREK